jgi:hypothetical protein
MGHCVPPPISEKQKEWIHPENARKVSRAEDKFVLQLSKTLFLHYIFPLSVRKTAIHKAILRSIIKTKTSRGS